MPGGAGFLPSTKVRAFLLIQYVPRETQEFLFWGWETQMVAESLRSFVFFFWGGGGGVVKFLRGKNMSKIL